MEKYLSLGTPHNKRNREQRKRIRISTNQKSCIGTQNTEYTGAP